jgi:arylsulfatase A-like enzyme
MRIGEPFWMADRVFLYVNQIANKAYMFLRHPVFSLAIVAMALDTAPLMARETSLAPNIVILFADNLGYGDVSCYGATKIQTPNINGLARDGLKFSDAHSAASLCSPSRYGLMTGYCPWRLHRQGNGYRLGQDRLTIAGFLQRHGCTTAAIGKWHRGYSEDWNKLPITGPLEVGFDYHFGVPSNHNDSTRAFFENHDLVGRTPDEKFRIVPGRDFPEGLAEPRVEDQVDTMLTNRAVAFIRKHADIVGHKLPPDSAEDSISLYPVMLGQEPRNSRRQAVFILGDGKDSSIAVCSGSWKLIVRYDAERNEAYELYDLEKDPGELNNLSKQQTKVTHELATALKKAEEMGRTRD